MLGPPRGLSSWGGPGLCGDIPLSPSCLATGRVCLWMLLMAPPAPQLEGPQGLSSARSKQEQTSWVTHEIRCSRGCLGSFISIQQFRRNGDKVWLVPSFILRCFYPELCWCAGACHWKMLCWTVQMEQWLENKRGWMFCWDPHRAWFWMVSELPGIGLSVKMASCKLTPFLASHVSLLKAFCRN